MNYSNSQRAGVILYLTTLIFDAYNVNVAIYFSLSRDVRGVSAHSFIYGGAGGHRIQQDTAFSFFAGRDIIF